MSLLSMQAHGVLSLQEAIQQKDQQLNEAYQVSLEAEMRSHAQEAAIGALETENHLLSAKNREYQESANYYKTQWENASAELEASEQNLLLAKDQIESQEQAIHALNSELLRVAPNSPRKQRRRIHDDDSKEELQEELAEQQKKYDRLQRECGKYQNDLSELARLKTRVCDLEGRDRWSSERISALRNVILDLESQISAYVRDLDLLRSQNTTLMTTATSKTPQRPSAAIQRLRTPSKTPEQQRRALMQCMDGPLTPSKTPVKAAQQQQQDDADLFAFREFQKQLDAIDEASDEESLCGDESLHTSLIVQHHLDHDEWMASQEPDGLEDHSLYPQFFHIDDDAASLPSLEGTVTSMASSMDTQDLNRSLLDRVKQTLSAVF